MSVNCVVRNRVGVPAFSPPPFVFQRDGPDLGATGNLGERETLTAGLNDVGN